MSKKAIIVCVLVGVLAYMAGTNSQGTNRPILRWVSRAVGVWLLFRDAPPQPQENARYVHTVGPDCIDHRNAL